MKKDFYTWLSSLRKSIANYEYYIDFETVYKKANEYKVEINILNSLVGSKDIEMEFKNIVTQYPNVLKCIPILLAKRESLIYCLDENGAFEFDFNEPNYSIDDYVYFMRKTGLFQLLKERLVSNLYDYVLGVEVGLNSNARKNRGGHLMEDLVESFINKAGFVNGQTYFKEMRLSDLETHIGLDLSPLSNSGQTEKIFDFVLITEKSVYGCECNFFSSSGSKLNETSRSYKTLALESKKIKGFEFVWFTDGVGWLSTKNNLKETFDVLDFIFNISELENGILDSF
ncbi:type II restriction endonuclease [Mycoplasma sp. 888]|uniref:type II restriction endonuclease n=1 Tax=Mycoplasma sp. 888 TaxID=3108483 RepID=UPI002D765CB6|nr:type II restriction endonuclease [Mycoplasma sp. 888]WRQ25694.1 type II restriction endonuclease [Mycoplasma sp. 888]